MAQDREKKKAEDAARRQQFQQARRRKALIRRATLGAVVLAAMAGTGYCVISERRFMADVATTDYPAARHMAGAIAYLETPPMGGPHNVAWQNCGIYSSPIHNEHAVHSLEHGAVWITYRPDLPVADIQRLNTLASDDYMLLSPFPNLPAPVVVSAWNHQVRLTGADDLRLPEFIRRYKNNPRTTPEFGASCFGGTAALATANSLNTGGGPMVR
jgi:hypothetical protein